MRLKSFLLSKSCIDYLPMDNFKPPFSSPISSSVDYILVF